MKKLVLFLGAVLLCMGVPAQEPERPDNEISVTAGWFQPQSRLHDGRNGPHPVAYSASWRGAWGGTLSFRHRFVDRWWIGASYSQVHMAVRVDERPYDPIFTHRLPVQSYGLFAQYEFENGGRFTPYAGFGLSLTATRKIDGRLRGFSVLNGNGGYLHPTGQLHLGGMAFAGGNLRLVRGVFVKCEVLYCDSALVMDDVRYVGYHVPVRRMHGTHNLGVRPLSLSAGVAFRW